MSNHRQLFILNLLAYAAQRDVSPEQLCSLAGLDLRALQKKGNFQPGSKQINDLWLNASHLSNDKLFGLHFGESMQLTALGVVGDIIKSSSTVGEAVTISCQLTHLITDLFQLKVTRTDKTFTIRFIPHAGETKSPSFSFLQTMDFFMVFVIHEMDGLLLNKIKPVSVRFPYSVTDINEYERVLRYRPVKKKDEYSITFENKFWNEPILTHNYEMQSHLLKRVSTLSKSQDEHSYHSKIYNYLMANSYLGLVSLEEIAANFNVSTRWLQRKLKDEGISFQQIADEVRKSLALHYLNSGNYPVKEISYFLGYNEISAFSRAFKRWTGTTPLGYQKEN